MRGEQNGPHRRGVIAGFGALSLSTAPPAFADTTKADAEQWPIFLPEYFSVATVFNGTKMRRMPDPGEAGSARFSTPDDSTTVTFTVATGDDARCDAVFNYRENALLTSTTGLGGRVLQAESIEFWARSAIGKTLIDTGVFRLPGAVLLAVVIQIDGAEDIADRYRADLKRVVDRWRYSQAAAGGSIIFGRWASSIHSYAQQLLAEGHKNEALSLLRQLSILSPDDFEAQVEFAELTPDARAKHDSASVVHKRAEDVELRRRAGRVLGLNDPILESLPLLTKGEKGLQIILVPLPPCDIPLAVEAAAICQKIVGFPVKLRRLKMPWTFGAATRIARQRDARTFILQNGNPATNFTGWTLDRYAAAILDIGAKRPPLEAYRIRKFVDDIRSRPGQIDIDPEIDKFYEIIESYRSSDRRTIYVGITATSIYTGSANFVFSGGVLKHDFGVDIVSQYMMLAKNADDDFESRPRAAERLAKEMVPASLQMLGIPRPTDPSDPYSYSSSVARTDEKSLILSAPTRQALDKIRKSATSRKARTRTA